MSLADNISAMTAHYPPAVRSRVSDPLQPLHARSASDSPAPVRGAGDRGSAVAGVTSRARPVRPSAQRIKRPGTGGPASFRPTAEHFANNPVPAMARATAPDVMRTPGRKIAGAVTRNAAVAASESERQRSLVLQRTNSVRDNGETPAPGTMYPNKISRRTGYPIISRNPNR